MNASFVILLAGLWLCFFHVPVAAVAGKDGLSVAAQKDVSDWVDAVREELGAQ